MLGKMELWAMISLKVNRFYKFHHFLAICEKKDKEKSLNKSYDFASKNYTDIKFDINTKNAFSLKYNPDHLNLKRRAKGLRNMFGSSTVIEFSNDQTIKKKEQKEDIHSVLWSRK